MYFVGEQEFLKTALQREEIVHALQDANVWHEMVVYQNVQLGFFCDERDTFDTAARDDAWQRRSCCLTHQNSTVKTNKL